MMMDYPFEENFVRKFIRKDRRDRLIHELTDPKKRKRGFNRFCHQAKELLDQRKIILQGKNIEGDQRFSDFVSRCEGPCKAVTADLYLEKEYPSLKDALSESEMCGDAFVIMGKDIAIVFNEPMKGGADKYLLTDKLDA